MKDEWTRRSILKLMGVGGVVYASALAGCTERGGAPPRAAAAPPRDFFFLQLTDTHWGFRGAANPDAESTLARAVAAVNAAEVKPAFVVFTGDLTQTTDDARERRARMAQFKEIVAGLDVKNVRFLPGEHDATPDRGEAYREAFGETHYAFDHEGVHFVALDNVSEPGGALGEAQLEWLAADVARLSRQTPLVVLAHRPLFDLYPDWEWATRDGARALEILARHPSATVLYGHIHQENHAVTGTIAHHAARSLVFPLPAPGAAPKRAPLPWDPKSPDHGLGYRAVRAGSGAPSITEIPLRSGA